MKIPKTLGACADRLFEIISERGDLNKDLEALKEERVAIEQHLIDNLPKSEAEGVTGKKANAIITRKSVPSMKDWDKFYKHILKTKDFSLMQKRLSEAAIKDRWEAKEEVPGVEAFVVVGVSVTTKKG